MTYKVQAEQAKKDGKTKQLTVEIKGWKEPGEFLIGKLEEVSEFTGGKFETSCNQYLFDTDDGLVTTLLGAAQDKQLDTKKLIGQVLWVTYKGKAELEDGRKVNKFDILDISNNVQVKE